MSEIKRFNEITFVVATDIESAKPDEWYTSDKHALGSIVIRGKEHKITAAKTIIFGDVAMGEEIILDNGQVFFCSSSGIIPRFRGDFD